MERAVETIFGEINTLVVRPGIVLGPHEDLGRLPDYLRRAAGGRRFRAGGRARTAWFQYVDARDLAEFTLTCAETGRPGPVRRGHPSRRATPGATSATPWHEVDRWPAGVRRRSSELLEAGVAPWRGLPAVGAPAARQRGLWQVNGQAALEYGFAPRPLLETVADTWTWLQKEGPDWTPTSRAAVFGIDPGVERAANRGLIGLSPGLQTILFGFRRGVG